MYNIEKTLIIPMLVWLFSAGHLAYADLIFSAPPRESKKEANEIYAPLARYMTHIFQEKVVFEYANNFLNYGNNMRAGKYDIVFDGSHFVSWRVTNINHKIVAKLPNKLLFYIVTQSQQIKSTRDLVGKKICTPSPPNLGTMILLEKFSNPAKQPMLVPVKGGFIGAAKGMKAGKCVAAVLRDNVYADKISNQDRLRFRVIFQSRSSPGQALTVGPKVSAQSVARLARGLVSDESAKPAKKLLGRFAKHNQRFEKALVNEYNGLNLLLEGVVFGWDRRFHVAGNDGGSSSF